MRTDLSSTIKLEQVSKRYYRPESEVDLVSLTRYEKVYTKVMETPAECAADAASDIARIIERTVEEKGRCVIGFGAGRCAIDIYDELVKLYFADKVSFANVVAFNLGELGLGGGSPEGQSTMRRLREHLFSKVDIEEEHLHTFDPAATKENVHSLCKNYETLIDEYGGLDLVVCELTKSASLAYNENGSTLTSSCRLVSLSSQSRQRLAESYQCESVPATAVTLGISNLQSAGRIIAAAWGDASAQAVFNTIEGSISELSPASYLQMHHNAKLVIDLEAASMLTRFNYPWKVTSCEWSDTLIRRALVWLSKLTGKPVLKLTNRDYSNHGLSELLTIFGSAYDVNIRVFNDLQHTITGWPGGKPNADDTNRPERATPYPKRALVFTPHPDDAVVAIGGTLRRLVQQGHDVQVCFLTSGDLAVSDEDLTRYLMFNRHLTRRFGVDSPQYAALDAAVSGALEAKAPGESDNADVRALKGFILASEAILSCGYLGVPQDHIHQLELPFYVEHPHGTGKITAADVAPIARLIEQVRPHQIFFADDLGDPYGTHERAANALLAAIDELKDEECMRECRVWMYRGQWGSWDMDHIQMAVPMSPEEFSYKRSAILKHQSQVHDAPYRDPDDEKQGWERSLDHDRATARRYSELGLACYEAIESFVEYIPPRDQQP